jgi:hypothetical protein
MTANEKVAHRKLSMLQLAAELKSVSEACRIMGYSRSQFYEIKRAFQTGGLDVDVNVKVHRLWSRKNAPSKSSSLFDAGAPFPSRTV